MQCWQMVEREGTAEGTGKKHTIVYIILHIILGTLIQYDYYYYHY